MEQRIRFCDVDGARIAFATVGRGPPLVCDTGWVSHLELAWQDGPYRRFFERLAARHTIVRFDRQGTGLSDRQRWDPSVEVDVRALEQVVAVLGLRRFAMFASSQAGATAVLFASRHPEQVTHLVLYGVWARGQDLASDEVKASLLSLIRANWGLGSRTLADIFVAGAGGEAAAWFAQVQRVAASPEVAADLLAGCYAADVTELLPGIRSQTLVLHRQQDRAVPFHHGREVAALIPNALFVPLQGTVHLPILGDVDPILDAVESFLAAPPAGLLTPRERQVAVLIADGLTTAEIADALGVAPKTADAHVEHIRTKLGVRSRAQIAAWVTSHQL